MVREKWIDFKKLDEAPEETVTELCRIDLVDIISTMQLHPALFAFASVSYEKAKIDEIQAKAEVDRIKADVFLTMAANDPTLPVNRLERLVETNDRYRAAVDAHHHTLRRAGTLRALTTALEHRRDMLIQIASRQKREIERTT